MADNVETIERDVRERCAALERGIRAVGAWTSQGEPPATAHEREVDGLDAGPDMAAVIRSQADFLMEHLADHGMAVAGLMAPPATPLAAFSCSRALVESALYVLWLTEAELEPKERVHRSLRLHYGDLDAQRLLFSESGDDVAELESSISELSDLAQVIGVSRLSKPTGFTSLARTHGAADEYRALSAVAHARLTFVRQLAFEPAGPPVAGRGTPFRKVLVSGSAEYALTTAVRWFSEAAWSHAQYLERSPVELRRLVQTMVGETKVSPALQWLTF